MNRNVLGLTIVLGMLTGCASSAKLVRADALGGRIALHGSYMPAMLDGRLLMAEHCQGPVVARDLGTELEFRCAETADGRPGQQMAARLVSNRNGL
jgi:hypothetical protein